MSKRIFAMLLFVASGNAAADWVPLGENDHSRGFVELTTIRRSGGVATMWDLKDFKSLQKFPTFYYLSMKAQVEYDCQGEKSRPLAYSFHSGQMGGGRVVLSESGNRIGWRPIAPDSSDAQLWKIACNKN